MQTQEQYGLYELLNRFSISPRNGFLPDPYPLESIANVDDQFAKLEVFAKELPKLVYTNQVRKQIRKAIEGDTTSLFPNHLDISKLHNKMQWERAMLLLSCIGHVYVHGNSRFGENAVDIIPSVLSVPWGTVADLLGRPPVLSHASIALHNWRLIDKNDPISLENIVLLNNIIGGCDEDWFFTVTIVIESLGAKGAVATAQICDLMNKDVINEELIIELLGTISEVLIKMKDAMKCMKQQCDPYIFYNRVRIYLNGWSHSNIAHPDGLLYEGWSEKRHFYHGGSAGQSTLLQCFDELLGIKHKSELLTQFRQYMPLDHQKFLHWIESSRSLRQYIKNSLNADLKRAFNQAMKSLNSFREVHIGIVHQYIMQQSGNVDQERGTGGSTLISFLSSVKQDAEYIEW